MRPRRMFRCHLLTKCRIDDRLLLIPSPWPPLQAADRRSHEAHPTVAEAEAGQPAPQDPAARGAAGHAPGVRRRRRRVHAAGRAWIHHAGTRCVLPSGSGGAAAAVAFSASLVDAATVSCPSRPFCVTILLICLTTEMFLLW